MAAKSETMIADGAIDTVIKIAQAAKRPETLMIPTVGLGEGLPPSIPLVYNPGTEAYEPVRDEIEAWRLQPRRRTGTATALTLTSFIELANRHKDGDSVLFANAAWPNPKLTAVLNYHTGPSGNAGVSHVPRHGDHRVVYAFPLTQEFKAWIGQDGKPMEQAAFAAFIEDHAAELADVDSVERSAYEPLFKERFASPSELITLSRALEIFVGAKIKRQERLATGERVLQFDTEHVDATGNKVDIPGIFMVSVKAFDQSDEVIRIPARLRYRIKGDITWFYQLYRWEHFLTDRVREDLKRAAAGTSLAAYEGEPEK